MSPKDFLEKDYLLSEESNVTGIQTHAYEKGENLYWIFNHLYQSTLTIIPVSPLNVEWCQLPIGTELNKFSLSQYCGKYQGTAQVLTK